jgi:hypothetical protein
LSAYLLSVRDALAEPCGQLPQKGGRHVFSICPQRSLPARPSLEQLHKRAKELLKAYRTGDVAAVGEVERFERQPDPAKFTLADAQRVLVAQRCPFAFEPGDGRMTKVPFSSPRLLTIVN